MSEGLYRENSPRGEGAAAGLNDGVPVAARPSKSLDPDFERRCRARQRRIRDDLDRTVQRDRDERVRSGAIERDYRAHMASQRAEQS